MQFIADIAMKWHKPSYNDYIHLINSVNSP